MTRRLRLAAAVALGSSLVLALTFVDAYRAHARLASRPRAEAVTHLLGQPDLALSSSARWLRHPSGVEPWAAVADLPAALDTEPAGGLLGPPTALFDLVAAPDRRRAP